MKTNLVLYLLLSTVVTLPSVSHAQETAQARIWCTSLRFQQGSDSFGDSTLDLSTVSGTPNGELLASGQTYASGFSLNFSGFPITGTIYFDIPPFTDANSNGWNDFFEVSQPTGGTTSGTYSTAIGGGTVSADWSRGAGSKDGTCVLSLHDQSYGDLGAFRHSFELIEYTGPLTFTPGTNRVDGTVNLTKTGDPASQLQGPVQFLKVATNRFNQLILQPGAWTNASAQTLTFTNDLFLRDQTDWPTNYYGYVDFDDGEPNTPAPDYTEWILSIDDPNDANHNQIPDFSDDPQLTGPRRPDLSLVLTATNLLLTISGDVGQTYQLQEAPAISNGVWQTVQSLTLTNDPQVVVLPLPSDPVKFWRAQTQ
jgi:hypothetical protein